MTAAHFTPLPPTVRPGAPVTGWAAFDIPRDAAAVLLRAQHLYAPPDSGWVSATGPVMIRR
jgi:hypothetical protein